MHLVRSTDADLVARDAASAIDWDPGLTPEQFVAREQVLRRTRFARRSHSPWAWVDGATVLSSTETYEVVLPQGRAWLVASVWTEPRLRGRGHASRMLDALAARCSRAPGAAALVLFSDVGAALYERVGFAALPAFDRVWSAVAADPDDGPWVRFSETELDAVPTRDPLQVEWQLDRARTRVELVGGRRPSRCGARVGEDWMVWTDDGAGGALLVLETSARDRVVLEDLVEAARRTAAAAGLGEVRMWDGGEPVGGERVPRVGQLPMVRALDPSVRTADFAPLPRSRWV